MRQQEKLLPRKDEVIKLFSKYSTRELARIFEVDHKTVHRFLNKYGIETAKPAPEKISCNLCMRKVIKRKRNSIPLCSSHYQQCRKKGLCYRCGMSLKMYPDRKSTIRAGYCDSCDGSPTESEFSAYQSPAYI